MKIIRISVLLLLFLVTLEAQTPSKGSITLSSFRQPLEVAATDTVKILAVMAEFQPDNDNTTVGNGTFLSIYSKDYGKAIVDPLPHDRNYFKAHLEFVKNYYRKVSNGKLHVEFEVLPNGVTLSKTMRNYSPPINSTDFRVMGDFTQETWTLADQANPGFNFAGYDLFIIFHAGVGRDVSLPGSLGNERDLPSIYFNLSALQKFYGGTFDGVPVSGGSFKIQNTGILPQTQNREVTSFNSTFLYKITMNGLMASTVGSYLGLPDLFDTNTGLSAIGRFGLMDGQSIFAYNGAFPPAPSPWERMRLGWETPVELKGTSLFPRVITRVGASVSDSTLLKLRINESEYFLIENRQRDANKDGAKVTLWDGTGYVTKTFLKDTTGFASFSIDSLYGVVVDIDEFDWALPGSGILVWHIDEKVINAKIADNKVNTDKKRRGVAVVEADGINDIGEKFYTIFGDEIVGEGTEYDLWFAENKADLYRNVFSNTSRPNSKTNDGANSLITMKDFPANANAMRFTVQAGDSLIKPYKIWKPFAGAVPGKVYLTDSYRFAINGNALISFDANFIPTIVKSQFSNGGAAFFEKAGKLYIIGSLGNKLYRAVANAGVVTVDSVELAPLGGGVSDIVSQKMITSSLAENEKIVVGTTQGKLFRFSLEPFAKLDSASGVSGTPIASLHFSGSSVYFTQQQDAATYYAGEYGSGVGTNVYPGKILSAIYTDYKGLPVIIALEEGNKLRAITMPYMTTTVPATSPEPSNRPVSLKGNSPVTAISVSDNRLDGNLYVNYTSGNELYSVNLTGAVADNFPVVLTGGTTFAGNTMAVDFTGTKHPEIISFTTNGLVYANDGLTGKLVDGFPLSTGEAFADISSHGAEYFVTSGMPGILTLGQSGTVNSWTLNLAAGTPFFYGKYGNDANTLSAKLTSGSVTDKAYMPEQKVYNYPNPATGTETFIRFYVDEDSDVTVKIFDLAGDFVADLKGFGQGGMDGEIRWDIRNIQSGVYLANVEATSVVSGKTGHKVIKIAIIK